MQLPAYVWLKFKGNPLRSQENLHVACSRTPAITRDFPGHDERPGATVHTASSLTRGALGLNALLTSCYITQYHYSCNSIATRYQREQGEVVHGEGFYEAPRHCG
jgi:hypothetical protein